MVRISQSKVFFHTKCSWYGWKCSLNLIEMEPRRPRVVSVGRKCSNVKKRASHWLSERSVYRGRPRPGTSAFVRWRSSTPCHCRSSDWRKSATTGQRNQIHPHHWHRLPLAKPLHLKETHRKTKVKPVPTNWEPCPRSLRKTLAVNKNDGRERIEENERGHRQSRRTRTPTLGGSSRSVGRAARRIARRHSSTRLQLSANDVALSQRSNSSWRRRCTLPVAIGRRPEETEKRTTPVNHRGNPLKKTKNKTPTAAQWGWSTSFEMNGDGSNLEKKTRQRSVVVLW